jgi:ribosomal protein L20A (L18A)
MNSNQTIAQFLKVKTYPFMIRDDNGKLIYYENSNGDWFKYEYDCNGKNIYYESSYGYWFKKEYDLNGNQIYYENSNGFWFKYEYDSNGKNIYWENSDGIILDNRPKPVLEITLEEIAALKGVSVSQIRIKE